MLHKDSLQVSGKQVGKLDQTQLMYMFHSKKHGDSCGCNLIDVVKLVNGNRREYDEFLIFELSKHDVRSWMEKNTPIKHVSDDDLIKLIFERKKNMTTKGDNI